MHGFKFYMLTSDCVMTHSSMTLEQAKKWYFSEILGDDDLLDNYDEEDFYEIKYEEIKDKKVLEEEYKDSPRTSVDKIVTDIINYNESLPAIIYATEW